MLSLLVLTNTGSGVIPVFADIATASEIRVSCLALNKE